MPDAATTSNRMSSVLFFLVGMVVGMIGLVVVQRTLGDPSFMKGSLESSMHPHTVSDGTQSASVARPVVEKLPVTEQPRMRGVHDAITSLKRMKRTLEKYNGTASDMFKLNIIRFCERVSCEGLTVVELGVFRGGLTSVLSHLFYQVLAVDVVPHFFGAPERVAMYGKRIRNVVFLNVDLYAESWYTFSQTHIDVIVVDANHYPGYVFSDLTHSLRIPGVSWMIFHDYNYQSVNTQVDLFQRLGYLECTGIGLMSEDGPEGAICSVKKIWIPRGTAEFFGGKQEWYGLHDVSRLDLSKQTGIVAVETCVVDARSPEVLVRCLDPRSTNVSRTGRAFLDGCAGFNGLCSLVRWEWDAPHQEPWTLQFDASFQSALVQIPVGSVFRSQDYVLMRHAQAYAWFDRLPRFVNNGMLATGFSEKAIT